MHYKHDIHRLPAVKGDPMEVQRYRLPNGLQLFLSVNPTEPRIHTNIAFRVGSKYDPPELTGLAHYMEHMLFKGSSRIGTLDWEREAPLLERISALFEQYRQTADPEERRALYRRIDKLSYEASQLAVPNEYDRLATAIGGKDINAYTWVEQTVYVCDIPAYELERWMRLESERFRSLALRLFHTELETVYEEYNIGQDNDHREVQQAMRQMLFPTHPYGTQSTIGRPEHLKNPSMQAIQDFFHRYYVPGNMAICMAGDFDPQEVLALAGKYWGDRPAAEVPAFEPPQEAPLDGILRREVQGTQAPFVQLAWRLDDANRSLPAVMIQELLHNQQAGLLDTHLNQPQRVLESDAWIWLYEDYGGIGLYGKPREGQSLEEVEQLLLEQVQRLHDGEFPDWMPEACANDMMLSDMRALEYNAARVGTMTTCFVLGLEWETFINRYELFGQLDKEALVQFARRYMPLDRYAVIHKTQQEEAPKIKVEAPEITALPMTRGQHSDWGHNFLAGRTVRPEPHFADFEAGILSEQWRQGLHFDYVYNPSNPTFRLDFILDMGKLNSRELAVALLYLPFLGTSRRTAAEVQQAFFRLGLQFRASAYNERSYLSLSGLEKNLEEGLALLSEWLGDLQPDAELLDRTIHSIMQSRSNARRDRSTVLGEGMGSLAIYGPQSPWTYRLSNSELEQLQAGELVGMLKDLLRYQHRIYYFGQREPVDAGRLIRQHFPVPERMKIPLPPKKFVHLPMGQHQVMFYDFPIVQSDILLLSRGTPRFSLEEYSMIDWYNEYFGYGLSSIVFQEIREAKALAYSTYVSYTAPTRNDRPHYLRGYVGTQPDKIGEALPTLLNLIEYMPVATETIEEARQSILQRIATDRIPPSQLYWEAQKVKDRGFDHDMLRDVYDRLRHATADDLVNFHREQVQGRKYVIMVLGQRKDLPMQLLERFGSLCELTEEEIFPF